jgi:hypothetical protein
MGASNVSVFTLFYCGICLVEYKNETQSLIMLVLDDDYGKWSKR